MNWLKKWLPLVLTVCVWSGTYAIDYGVGIRPITPQDPTRATWFMYNLDEGDSFSDTIEVHNTTDEPKAVYLYSADAAPTSGGGHGLRQRSEPMLDFGQWVVLDQTEFILQPREKITVPFTVTIPNFVHDDFSEEEYCGGIAVEYANVDQTAQPGKVRLRKRNAVRIYNHYQDGKCGGNFEVVCHKDPRRNINRFIKVPKVILEKIILMDDYYLKECPTPPEYERTPIISVHAIPEERSPNRFALDSVLRFYYQNESSPTYTLPIQLDERGKGEIEKQLDSGEYDVALKGESHLTKFVREKEFLLGEDVHLNYVPQGKDKLLAGDVDRHQDDFINAMDISATVNAFYKKDIPYADLNKDGIVNSYDLRIELNNIYKRGEKR